MRADSSTSADIRTSIDMFASADRAGAAPARRSGCFARVAGLALLSCSALPAYADDGTVNATYDITLAGVSIGVATMAAKIDGSAYNVDMHAKLTGLAGVLTSGKGGAKASGRVSGDMPSPVSLAVVSSTGETTRSLRLAFDGDRVDAVEIKPPLEDWEKPDRVPVKDGDKRGVVDPLSALLMPVAAGSDPREACQRTIPIFDGATRFNVVLSYSRTTQVQRDTYRGPAVVCQARYVPVSGHRPTRSVTRYMEQNREMSAWLIPVGSTNVYVPYKVSVKTMVGTTVLEASRLTIASAQTAAMPAKKTKN